MSSPTSSAASNQCNYPADADTSFQEQNKESSMIDIASRPTVALQETVFANTSLHVDMPTATTAAATPTKKQVKGMAKLKNTGIAPYSRVSSSQCDAEDLDVIQDSLELSIDEEIEMLVAKGAGADMEKMIKKLANKRLAPEEVVTQELIKQQEASAKRTALVKERCEAIQEFQASSVMLMQSITVQSEKKFAVDEAQKNVIAAQAQLNTEKEAYTIATLLVEETKTVRHQQATFLQIHQEEAMPLDFYHNLPQQEDVQEVVSISSSFPATSHQFSPQEDQEND